jgi:excisionase family DNA binding protein
MAMSPERHETSWYHDSPDASPLMLSIPQAAQLLGIGLSLCRGLITSGQLASVRLGRRVLIPRAAVERLARAQDESRAGRSLVGRERQSGTQNEHQTV